MAIDRQWAVTIALSHSPVAIPSPRRDGLDGSLEQGIGNAEFQRSRVNRENGSPQRGRCDCVDCCSRGPRVRSAWWNWDCMANAEKTKMVVCRPGGLLGRGVVQDVCRRCEIPLVDEAGRKDQREEWGCGYDIYGERLLKSLQGNWVFLDCPWWQFERIGFFFPFWQGVHILMVRVSVDDRRDARPK